MPASVSVELRVPPGFETSGEFRRLVDERVRAIESAAAAERRRTGRRVIGRRRVLRQHWNDHPASRAPRRGLSPRVACINKWARIEALQRNKRWLDWYADSRTRHATGEKGVVFPSGTYWLARHSAVKVAPSDYRPG